MSIISNTHNDHSLTPYVHKVDHVFSTADAVEFPILNLFNELWRISLDGV
jgi:hypothetical protein